jgi:sorbitol/mannitol transport system substrate-binding protein
LYAWSWAIEKASKKKDNAWKFMSWASSKDYEETVGSKLGWTRVPAGKRLSTYDNPDYVKASSAFAGPTKSAILAADPENAGVQPRPVPGIQFMDFPEFSALATTVSQYISTAIAGQLSVDSALKKGQAVAKRQTKTYRSKS